MNILKFGSKAKKTIIDNYQLGLINGPNLNMLGISRNKDLYGDITLDQIQNRLKKTCLNKGYDLHCFQSNHQGHIIDFIQNHTDILGWIINPGALMIHGHCLADAIIDANKPFIEVHLSKIFHRESKRHISVISPYCIGHINGFKDFSYDLALLALFDYLEN